jgi:hypothetical protein
LLDRSADPSYENCIGRNYVDEGFLRPERIKRRMKRKFIEPQESETNLVIFSDEEDQGPPLYGHSIAKRFEQTRKKPKDVVVIKGISYVCYIMFVKQRFPDCKEVQEAWHSMTGLTKRPVSSFSKPSMTALN